jgi:uncharacterized protein YfaS (alpha-2-macroglobulin family)
MVLRPSHFNPCPLFLVIWVMVCVGVPGVLTCAAEAAAAPARASGPAGPPRLIRITPSGDDVPVGQQIAFEFDRSIVPIGRMEREASEVPVTIEPAMACRWRWLNPATLACQLPEKSPLLPATRYHITVRPEITAESGATLPEVVKHSFLTQRPVVKNTSFRSWAAPGTPQLVLWFSQPVDQTSVAAHVFFQVAGQKRFPAFVTVDPQFRESTTTRKGQVWMIQPENALPPDQPVAVQVEPGITSLEGKEPGVQNQALLQFHSFGEFRMVGVECQDLKGKTFTVPAGAEPSATTRCNPNMPIALLFSAPPLNEELKQRITVTPDLAEGKADVDPWEDIYVDSSLSQPNQKSEPYFIMLPMERIKPFTEYRVEARAGSLKDAFGRRLETDGWVTFATDHYPPNFDLFRDMPVLEKGLDTDLPVAATNLKKLKVKYRTVAPGKKSPPQTKTIDLPSMPDRRIALPLGLRPMVGRPSGIVQGEVVSEPPISREEGESGGSFFAQITPFHIHVKYGHHNTLVWVTDLASGAPVPGAQLEMHEDTLSGFHERPRVLAKGTTGEDGVAMLPGTSTVDPELKFLSAYGSHEKQLFLWCRKGDDVAVLPFTYSFQVSSEGSNREYIPEWMRPHHGHLRTWGTTAQGIYRAGDTVQYKVYVRDQDNRRFVAPPGVPGGERAEPEASPGRTVSGKDKSPTAATSKVGGKSASSPEAQPKGGGAEKSETPGQTFTYRLKVMDPMDKVVHERKDVQLSAFGAFDGSFPLARTAAVGWYRFVLTSSFTRDEELEPMRVLVSDFTPSSFKVSAELNGKVFSLGDSVTVTTQAALHAGGPYAGAETRVNARIETQPFDPGTAITRGFEFDVVEHTSDGFYTPDSQSVFQTEKPLDDQGTLETSFQITDNPIIFGRLVVESGVKDDRGKRVAHRASAIYAGRDQYVGLSQGDWSLEEKKPASARAVVVNREGEPVPGVPIRVAVERRETKVAQVKGAGKGYIPQYSAQWVAEENLELTSGAEPVPFTFTPQGSGVYRIRARIGNVPDPPGGDGEATDSEPEESGPPPDQAAEAGPAAVPGATASGEPRGHQTILRRYVVGRSHVVWESLPGNVMDVVPDKKSYQTGETARFLVQNPFPGCRALITVERFGVMKSWIQTLETSSEIIEIPIVPDHLPGFYLSVLVVSPRVDQPMGEDGEDLGKPTFRMGYAEVPVKDSAKQITLDIKQDREVYKPRETVTVDLTAMVGNLPAGEGRPPVELAVAVLDEAIFALLPGKKVFDPYEGFYSLDPLDLSNYNLIMQLVGRQKLEKKGANPGGGGGPDLGMRSDFRFVAYWNPSLATDADGKARIQFKLPDSLTGWRILALAVTPEDRMGLGEQVFRVNQPTEIRPALPNQMTDGDRLDARFTVMNRTGQPRMLDVVLEARGPIVGDPLSVRPPGAEVLSKELSGSGTSTPPAPQSPGSTPPAGGVVVTHRQQLALEPFTRQVVSLPIEARGHGVIEFVAQAGDSSDRDAMTVSLPVGRRNTLAVAAVHGMTTEPETSEKILFPADMVPETGRLKFLASPTVLGGLEGAFEYMRDYPYLCWEQMLTKGLMAAFYRELRPYFDKSFVWAESDELPAATVARAAEFQASSGGMCYFVPKLEYTDPYLSAFTALGLGWLKARGHAASPAVEEGLEKYLQSLLQHEPTAGVYSRSMNATTRAVVLLALAERGKLPRNELERFEKHVPEMSLFGKALYLQALTRVAGTGRGQKEVLRQILASADQTAAGVVFRETLDPRVQNLLLSSPARDNSAILSSLLAYELAQSKGRSELGSMPLRLLHTVLQGRMSRHHWRSTQENLFAVKALIDFSRTYEQDRGPLTVQAWLDSLPLGSGEFKALSDPPLSFDYRLRGDDPGRKATARMTRTGQGPLYYSLSLSYDTPVPLPGEPGTAQPGKPSAPDGRKPAEPSAGAGFGDLAGIEVHREYSVERDGNWVLLKGPEDVKMGDLVRVDLFVSAEAERYFVVLDDPIPGGMEPVNRDLATASLTDAEKGKQPLPEGSYGEQFQDLQRLSSSRWAFYHRELRHEAARFYSEILPAGRYHLTYVAQAIAPGTFTALPPRAEEMYNPEVFGKGRAAVFNVNP